MMSTKNPSNFSIVVNCVFCGKELHNENEWLADCPKQRFLGASHALSFSDREKIYGESKALKIAKKLQKCLNK